MKINRVALILAFVIVALLWIEHGNHITIESPAAAEYRPCPDSDATPYGASCIEFMMGSHLQGAAPIVSN